MRRQFRLSISPISHKANLDYSISLNYGYIRSKEQLIEKLRFHNPPSNAPIRRKPIVPRSKKTISITDFTDILEERFKLPNLSKNNEPELKESHSALIKDIFSFPPSKASSRNQMKIPQNVINTLAKVRIDTRLKSPYSQPRYINSMPKLQRDVSCEQYVSRSPIIGKLKKRKHKTQFQIEPWNSDSQMGNTGNNFNLIKI